MGPTWAHLCPIGPRWAPCWSHGLCYQGVFHSNANFAKFSNLMACIDKFYMYNICTPCARLVIIRFNINSITRSIPRTCALTIRCIASIQRTIPNHGIRSFNSHGLLTKSLDSWCVPASLWARALLHHPLCTYGQQRCETSFITLTSQWARWRPKSPASRLFTELFIQAQWSKKTPKSASLAFVQGIHRWIPRTKGQ